MLQCNNMTIVKLCVAQRNMSLFHRLFPVTLPCIKVGVFRDTESQPCLKDISNKGIIKELRCPVCDKLKTEMDSYQTQAYKAGYDYVAWVVTKGPNCELVTFASQPTEQELRDRFGKDLISVVPL